MASWDSYDSKNNLLKKWLDSFRALHTGNPTGPAYEYRFDDSDNNIFAKLCRNYNAAFSTPVSADYAWMPADSDCDILRKILSSLHYGNTLTDNDVFSWRPMDNATHILRKLVRCHCAISQTSNPYDNVLPFDNDVWCLRKIVAQQVSAGTGDLYNFNGDALTTFSLDPLTVFP